MINDAGQVVAAAGYRSISGRGWSAEERGECVEVSIAGWIIPGGLWQQVADWDAAYALLRSYLA